jgi:hypothetical protein
MVDQVATWDPLSLGLFPLSDIRDGNVGASFSLRYICIFVSSNHHCFLP